MKRMIICFFVSTFTFVFANFNDFHFEGTIKAWSQVDSTEKRLEIIRPFLPQNPMIFEVGAFEGFESVKLAKAWPNGTVISFEPIPKHFIKYFEKALHYSNMHGCNLAVNTYNGTASLNLCWGTYGMNPVFEGASSLLFPSEDMIIHYMGPIVNVPCVIFDDWCQEHQIQNFDLLWLDLEGFELQFLQSSPKILNTVKVIYAETNFYPFRIGMTQFPDLLSFLQSQGFTLIAHWYHEDMQGNAIFVRY